MQSHWGFFGENVNKPEDEGQNEQEHLFSFAVEFVRRRDVSANFELPGCSADVQLHEVLVLSL